MKTKMTNPHAWFFGYLKTVEGWGQGYNDVIKEGIISHYTDGKTSSLSEMYERYNTKYQFMRKDLLRKVPIVPPTLDADRKRLIALLFSYCQSKGYAADIDYVKKIACRAAGVTRFNLITQAKLRQLYRTFGEKSNKEADHWVSAVFDKVTQE